MIELLKEVAAKVAGKQAEALIELLYKKTNVNEFKIAEKLGMTINQARNIFYKLYAANLLSFTRKKDKRRGWYIYFWTLMPEKALELLAKLKEKEIQQQEYILKSRKTKRFFYCKNCKLELTEESAMYHNFSCPECGRLLGITEKEEEIKEISKNIERLKQELSRINEIRQKPEEKKKRKEKKEKEKKEKEKKESKKKVKKRKK